MRFVVQVSPAEDGWQVRIPRFESRLLRRHAEEPSFPVSPAGPPAIDVRESFQRIAAGVPEAGEVADFGRYLFDVLLGEELWQGLKAAAGEDLLELVLDLTGSAVELERLPWEMMCSGTGFLAAEGRPVAVTRLVEGPEPEGPRPIDGRVLFVVGGELQDPELRPGAEYLGLVRRLESRGLGLDSHLLLRASAESLGDALHELRPSVVHFICHGTFEGGGARLQLLDADGKVSLSAEQLAAVLCRVRDSPDGEAPYRGPAMVVLNACHSGRGAVGGASACLPSSSRVRSLAAELVARGVPRVIGMGGRVADRACRIFTRRFYEALLADADPVRALAEGRRAGHGEGAAPSDTVDWALPTLFLDPRSEVEIRPTEAASLRRRREALERFASLLDQNPAAFCDRFACLADYEELTSPVLPGISRKRLMVIYDTVEPARKTSEQYGRSRLLEEIGLQAIRNGHVPCLVQYRPGDQPAGSLLALANRIRKAIDKARSHFDLEGLPAEVLKLRDLAKGNEPRARLDPRLLEMAEDEGPDAVETVAMALRLDLLALREEARRALARPQTHVLVLIDDLHMLGATEKFLDDRFLSADGFGVPGDPIPVVFSFARDEQSPLAYDALLSYVGRRMRAVAEEHLQAFAIQDLARDRLPYEQYLLHLTPPLVPCRRRHDEVAFIFQKIHEEVRGIPSRLKSPTLQDRVEMAAGLHVLLAADDEDWLARQGGAP